MLTDVTTALEGASPLLSLSQRGGTSLAIPKLGAAALKRRWSEDPQGDDSTAPPADDVPLGEEVAKDAAMAY
jgi:hypothetical protein